jgi:hypothetical protein
MSTQSETVQKLQLKKFWIILVILLVITFLSKDYFIPSTWNYRIMVKIETPEGVKSGSAVRQISNIVPSSFMVWPGGGNPARIKGEAVIIDLEERGLVFALLSDRSDDRFYKAFPTDGPSTAKGIRYYRSLKAGTKAEITSGFPSLVTFKDLNDSLSVTAINPKDMTEMFGKGVSVKGIDLEITNMPATWKIKNTLPWLKNINGGYLNGSFSGGGPELSNILHGGNFNRGNK